jgi:hypothetical protein
MKPMLKELIKQLPTLLEVPPVPSVKNRMEPLQATNGGAVPPVPSVPSEKTKVQREALKKPETFISCGQCLNFKCHNQHSKGAGYCLAGVMPGGASHWSETKHQCTQFDPCVEWIELPEPKPDAIVVSCYTPNGKAVQIEAVNQEHADWLIRMNPKGTGS